MADTATLKRATNKWSRLIHVYTSMAALLLVLFFGITGITLNHPTWSIGDSSKVTTSNGTLPMSPMKDGSIDYLSVSEFARDELGVRGQVEDFDSTGTSASIRYRQPGYAGDLTFSTTTGEYELVTDQQGMFWGVMNDLHNVATNLDHTELISTHRLPLPVFSTSRFGAADRRCGR